VRLEAEVFGPGAQGVRIARRLEHLTLELAPVARGVAVLLTKLAQAEPPARPQFFDEPKNGSCNVNLFGFRVVSNPARHPFSRLSGRA
jgi:hypothetical protein